MENRPRVGIVGIIIKEGKILMLKRKNSLGKGCWGFVGGHLEYKESWEDCLRREVKEEVDIEITNIRFGTVTNDIFEKENKHYIGIFMVAEYLKGEIKNMEPEKCEQIEWYSWDDLPEPLYQPILQILDRKFNPFNV